jgi:hypothetical protein
VAKDNGFRMRQDCGVDIVFQGLVVALSVITTFSAFRRGADDTSWEWRWRSLNPEERSRIAAAATVTTKAAQATLASPEEVELGAGYRRRRKRRHAYIELPVLSLLLIVAALSLIGLLSAHVFGFLLAFSAIFSSLSYFVGEYQKEKQRPAAPGPDAAV